MTRLNFDRPYFRYIDNLRRELRRQADGRGPDVFVTGLRPSVDSTRKSSDEPRLSKWEAGLALNLLNALGSYIEASSDLISALAPGRKGGYKTARKRRDEAETVLLSAAKRSVVQMVVSESQANSNFLMWYQELEHGFGNCGGEGAWDILNNFAMREAAEAVETMLQEQSHVSTGPAG